MIKATGKLLVVLWLFFSVSADSSDHSDFDHPKMKDVVSYLFEVVWNAGEFAGVDDVWHENVEFHFRGTSKTVSPDDLRNIVMFWRTGFPDFEFTVHQLIAEGDTVAARLSFTGTHTGNFGEVEPTNQRINVSEMMFIRFVDNRVVEAWEDYDQFGMSQQLGILK